MSTTSHHHHHHQTDQSTLSVCGGSSYLMATSCPTVNQNDNLNSGEFTMSMGTSSSNFVAASTDCFTPTPAITTSSGLGVGGNKRNKRSKDPNSMLIIITYYFYYVRSTLMFYCDNSL